MAEQRGSVDLRDLNQNTAGRDMMIALTIFIIFDFIFISIRFHTRRIKHKSLELNDYTILGGFILLTAIYALEIVEIVYGGQGLPTTLIVETLVPGRYVVLMKCIFAAHILCNISAMLIKISILHLYLSLFYSIPSFVRMVYFTMFLTVLLHTAIIVEVFAICSPLESFWDRGLTMEGHCAGGTVHGDHMSRVVPVLLILILDVMIFIIPVPILWTLNMSLSKKLATTSVFGLSLGIVITSAIRLTFIFDNGTLSSTKFGILEAVEPMVGVMVGCAPMIQPAVEHLSRGRITLWGPSRSRHASEASNTIVTTANSDLSMDPNPAWPQKSHINAGKDGVTTHVVTTHVVEIEPDSEYENYVHVEMEQTTGRRTEELMRGDLPANYIHGDELSLAEEGRYELYG
ncbi:hypothetical protein K504DRAFT_495608 [Pleomassaria siparia CBS 279.74]|uniref:Rhodopsin domain-containing protein n=1 Tax=Pleomassaria siparia CBS 279.74 TaxID=1314801 RepID=A0A6G1JTK2_9PLEO|nr:hypothetical protein K504DRAFT_495608 [Pleomassaria siparia CBS 279.74]